MHWNGTSWDSYGGGLIKLMFDEAGNPYGTDRNGNLVRGRVRR